MLIQNRRNPARTAQPLPTERRVLTDRRRDHVTRALVASKLIARDAENLPDGPARQAALAALMRLAEEVARAEQKQLARERIAVKQELRELAVMLQDSRREHRELQKVMREKARRARNRTMILLWLAAGLLVLKLVLP